MSKKRTTDRTRRLFALDESDTVVDATSKYVPLPSVWFGDDAGLLEKMLCFYPHKRPTHILDATINAGRFWRGSRRKVVGMDIDAKFSPDVHADNCNMP